MARREGRGDTPAQAKSICRRAIKNPDIRAIVERVLDHPDARWDIKKNGILFYGPTGTANCHFTSSDHMVTKALVTQLRAAGLEVKRETVTRTDGRREAALAKVRAEQEALDRQIAEGAAAAAQAAEEAAAAAAERRRAQANAKAAQKARVDREEREARQAAAATAEYDRIVRQAWAEIEAEAEAKRKEWPLSVALRNIRMGYSPQHVAQLTGWPVEALVAA